MIDELEKVPWIKFKQLDFDYTSTSENIFDEENDPFENLHLENA